MRLNPNSCFFNYKSKLQSLKQCYLFFKVLATVTEDSYHIIGEEMTLLLVSHKVTTFIVRPNRTKFHKNRRHSIFHPEDNSISV
jgi:hypothetical protein